MGSAESIVNTGRSMEMELDALVSMDYQNYGVHPWACTRPASGNYILIVQLISCHCMMMLLLLLLVAHERLP